MVYPWDIGPDLSGQEELRLLYERALVVQQQQQQQQLQRAPVAAAMARSSTTTDDTEEIHSWELPLRNHQHAALPQLAATLYPGLPWGQQQQQAMQQQALQQQALQQQRAVQQALLSRQIGSMQAQQNPYANVPTHLLQSMLTHQLLQQQQGGMTDRAVGSSLEENSAPTLEEAQNPDADRISPKKKRKLNADSSTAEKPKSIAKETGDTTLSKPKKPLSAYNMFFKDKREEMLVQRMQEQAESSQKGGFSGMAKEVGAMWKSLDPDMRRMYEERAMVAKSKYLEQLKQWEEASKKEHDRVASEALVMMHESSMDEDEESDEESAEKEATSGDIKMDSFGKKLFTALVDKKTPKDRAQLAAIEYDSDEGELVGDDAKPGRSAPFLGKRAASAAPNMNLVNAMYLSMLAQPQQQGRYPQQMFGAAQAAALLSQSQKIARGSSSSSLSDATNEGATNKKTNLGGGTSHGSDEVKGGKQSHRRPKKPKDKPKRPLSSYNLFFRDERERLLAGKSDDEDKLGFREMGRAVGAKWKALPNEERAQYDKKAEDEKSKYFHALQDWKQSKEEREEAAMVMVSNLQMGWIRESFPGGEKKEDSKLSSQTDSEVDQQARFGESVDDEELSAKIAAEPTKPDKAQTPQDEEGSEKKKKPKQEPLLNNSAERAPKKSWRKRPRDKPKRPLSAYNLFFRAEREKMVAGEEKKKLGFQEMARVLGAKWRSLDAESRDEYDQLAVEEKRKYFQALEDWKEAKLAAKEPPMSIRGGGYNLMVPAEKGEQQPTACLLAGASTMEGAQVGNEEKAESLGENETLHASLEKGKTDNGEKSALKEGELPKCSKCGKRAARRACSQLACLPCCGDVQCEGHKEAREKALLDNAILNGTTEVNRRAAAKRAAAILPGTFREPGFAYLGETAMVWSLRDYFAVPKWRDDAVRRSIKRNQLDDRTTQIAHRPCESRPKRFKRVMDDLYKQSLQAVEPWGVQAGVAKK